MTPVIHVMPFAMAVVFRIMTPFITIIVVAVIIVIVMLPARIVIVAIMAIAIVAFSGQRHCAD